MQVTRSTRPRRTRRVLERGGLTGLVALALVASLGGTAGAAVPGARAAQEDASLPSVADTVYDGGSPERAAASCYEIKQVAPNAPSGVYWLQTRRMRAPEQFYCDQETAGGGWVLLGRGRNGWTINYNGQGTTAQVRSDVASAGGFKPAQLPGELVDQLIDGAGPQDLQDGYLLRRATNVAGSSWQDVRFSVTRSAAFTWAFSGGATVVSPTVDGRRVSAGTTRNFGGGIYATDIVDTQEQSRLSYEWGWSFNPIAGVSTSADTFVYGTPGGRVMPMSQLLVRPRLTQETEKFQDIPEGGSAAASSGPARADSGALATPWGVAERVGNNSNENYSQVQAFAQVGQTMFAGGNFQFVQRDEAGTDRTEQPYLAAFRVGSREWNPDFRPTFDGQVKSLAALPGNRLAVGGQFTTVNSVTTPGFVVLDATTGQIDDSWKLTIVNRVGTSPTQVLGMSVSNGYLYLGGSFTHLKSGNAAEVYARNAARLNLATGAPDKDWRPEFNWTVYSLHQAEDSPYVFAAGYFMRDLRAGQGTARALARIDAGPGAQVANWIWQPSWPSGDHMWAWGAQESRGRVWAGATEHIFRSYDISSLDQLSTNLTLPGGDFQTVDVDDDVVYSACHCDKWAYEGAQLYTGGNIPPAFTTVDNIDLVGAWDTRTGERVRGFQPKFKGMLTQGIWATTKDSLGNRWVGGDLVKAFNDKSQMKFTGGFAVFPPRDVTPPATPADAAVQREGTTDTLSWQAAEGATTYQVLRNDRVVAVVTASARKASVPATSDARYFVRAADANGNVSASSPVLTVSDAAGQP